MKKILTAALAAFFTSIALGATLSPITLLNPSGSSSGQAIVSTGASSAPAWGGVGLNGIAAIGANTVLGNATGSSAAPTALTVPSCSTSSSALNYTTSGGAGAWTCNTAINASTAVTQGSANSSNLIATTQFVYNLLASGLAPASFTTLSSSSGLTVSGGGASVTGGISVATGGISVTSGAIAPVQTTGITGTNTNNNAIAGAVGEYVTNSTTGTSVTSGTPVNATSESLAAGDWDVQCEVITIPAGSTVVTQRGAAISTTSATLPSSISGAYGVLVYSSPAGQAESFSSPVFRESLSATTTVYCVAPINFTTSTLTVNGFIRARRVR